MIYLISYDLNNPGNDYAPFYKALSTLGAQKILMSRWILKHPKEDIKGLRNHLWKFMDEKDRLLVTSLDKSNLAFKNLMIDINSILDP